LEGFAEDIFESLPRKDQRARGVCYLRGLMLDGRRKSVEPMTQRLGGEVHYQALHHFVAVSSWDWRPVRRRLAEMLVTALEPTAWAVDDTGFPKDGEHSVGVQRQYCEDGGARRPRAWSDSRQYRLRASPVICRPGSEAVSRHHRVGVVSL
jgi:SRSO17 transposase